MYVNRYCPYCGKLQCFKYDKETYDKILFLRLECLACSGVFITGKSDKDKDWNFNV